MEPSSDPSDPEALQRPREPFSARKKAKTHPLEQALVTVVSGNLVFQPWALGGTSFWGQWVSLALGILSLALAATPRTYDDRIGAPTRFRLYSWPKLFKFPIFWLGLALLALVVTQALNPSWEYRTDGKNWWMAAIPHLKWLPTGVRVPFRLWGPWRMLLLYTPPFLIACAIWIGFTRRRTIRILLLSLVVNAIALSVFGIIQHHFGNGKIFWRIPSINEFFFASFIYKNHAGEYLVLMLGPTSALATRYYLRGLRRLQKSTPSGVFAFFTLWIVITVFISGARGASLAAVIYIGLLLIALAITCYRLPDSVRPARLHVGVLAILTLTLLYTSLATLKSEIPWARFQLAVSGRDSSIQSRIVATRAAAEMLKDHYAWGTGSGSFRSMFPLYQQHYPPILNWESGVRMFWEHAHNDILELPIELGLLGTALIALAFAFWCRTLIKNGLAYNLPSFCIVLSCLVVMAMSWGDFVFANPAILTTWVAFWPCSVLQLRDDERWN